MFSLVNPSRVYIILHVLGVHIIAVGSDVLAEQKDVKFITIDGINYVIDPEDPKKCWYTNKPLSKEALKEQLGKEMKQIVEENDDLLLMMMGGKEGGTGLNKEISKVINGKTVLGDKGTNKSIPEWKGSGPASGVLGVNSNSVSVEAIKNYYPPKGGIEFVFDPKSNTFLVGKPKEGLFTGSAHQQLAKSIDADELSVVGGTFSRGKNGEIFTTENSGHYGKNWTSEARHQFEEIMKKYGLSVSHQKWEK